MLMHHADAVADGFPGGADPDRLAVDPDLAGVGFVETVKDRHQRRLAGPVLADDAVNDAALHSEVDVIVGVNRAEALVDADQLDGGRGTAGLAGQRLTPLERFEQPLFSMDGAVIARSVSDEAIQRLRLSRRLDCFASLAMTKRRPVVQG